MLLSDLLEKCWKSVGLMLGECWKNCQDATFTWFIRNNVAMTEQVGDVMAEVLLRELSNADIDWLIHVGDREEVEANRVIIQRCKQPSMIYLLLEGSLAIVVPSSQRKRDEGRLSITQNNSNGDQELMRLMNGEIVGEATLFESCFMPAAIKTVEDSLLLAIDQVRLVEKLERDDNFGSHFYRAIALMLAERFRRLLEIPDQIRATADRPMKEALFVFSELRDSDVDWLVAVGEIQSLAVNRMLLQAGKPVDALHIILGGLLQVSAPEGNYNPLMLCFECENKRASLEKPIATVSRGQISGATSFLDFRPHPTTITAVEPSLVLSIPRRILLTRLQQDVSFSSRFYRILSIQLLDSLQMIMSQFSCGQTMNSSQQKMSEKAEYDDELNLDSLYQFSQGAARFNWMLKRLGII
jgi:bacteriocin-type transport-associated protein